jgi:DNA replication protein DnaC
VRAAASVSQAIAPIVSSASAFLPNEAARYLSMRMRDGTFPAKLRTYTAPTVLVVDDVGLLPVPPGGAAEIFHVVNTRYQRGHPTLVTTNRGLPEWGHVFGDPVVAGAILGRLMHGAIALKHQRPILADARTPRPRNRQPHR